jgi:hypothetical protein
MSVLQQLLLHLLCRSYTLALAHDPFIHTLWSNRSACYAEGTKTAKRTRHATFLFSIGEPSNTLGTCAGWLFTVPH